MASKGLKDGDGYSSSKTRNRKDSISIRNNANNQEVCLALLSRGFFGSSSNALQPFTQSKSDTENLLLS